MRGQSTAGHDISQGVDRGDTSYTKIDNVNPDFRQQRLATIQILADSIPVQSQQ